MEGLLRAIWSTPSLCFIGEEPESLRAEEIIGSPRESLRCQGLGPHEDGLHAHYFGGQCGQWREQADPRPTPSVSMLFCVTFSNLLNLSGLRCPHWDGLMGLPRFLPLWEFQAEKQSLGIEDAAPRQRAVGRLLFSSCSWPTSCAEAKAKTNQDRERGGRPHRRLR